MTRRGVVLGGGGVVGVAWLAGALAALEREGIDLIGDADVIVGTSAGSIVGARMTLGASAVELEREQSEPMEVGGGSTAPDLTLLGQVFATWTAAETMTEDIARAACALALKAP